MSVERPKVADRLSAILCAIQELQAEAANTSPDQLKQVIGSGVLDEIGCGVAQLRTEIESAIKNPSASSGSEVSVERNHSSKLRFVQCDDLGRLSILQLRGLADHLFYLYTRARTNDDRRALLRDIEIIKIEIFSGREQLPWEEPNVTSEIPLPQNMSRTDAYNTFVLSLEAEVPAEKSVLFEKQPLNPFDGYHVPRQIREAEEKVDGILHDLHIDSDSCRLLFALRQNDREMADQEVASYGARFHKGFEDIRTLCELYSSADSRLVQFLEGQIDMLKRREIPFSMGVLTISDSDYAFIKAGIIDPLFIPELAKLK